MNFSLPDRTVSLGIGEFSTFSLGPQESSGGPQGLWRAQLGQHWHTELQKRTEQEFTVEGQLRADVRFEVPIDGRLTHRGWTFTLTGRIDQQVGSLLREIKSVLRPIPAAESELRADYPAYFLQLATYVVLQKTLNPRPSTLNPPDLRAELIFVEAGAGLSQTVALTPFDEALVFHQLDAVVEFLNLQLRASARRRALQFNSPFASLRPGQETIQRDLAAAFGVRIERRETNVESQKNEPSALAPAPSTTGSQPSTLNSQPSTLFFEAPTGYGKTGSVLEFALGQLQSGRFSRVVWLTSKSTGQLQVVKTLQDMTGQVQRERLEVKGTEARTLNSQLSTPNSGTPVPVWQVRNKSEHCINHTFHCVRDGCDFLRDCAERWPASGLSRFYLDERQPRDLETLRTAGRHALICPYEITRASLPSSDVWIGDYNYVFAPSNRGLFFERPGFDPSTTLLVVDEAHNLTSRVAGAYSHTANESDARLLLAELDHLRAPTPLVLAIEEWTKLLASLEPAASLDPMIEGEIRELVPRIADLTTATVLDYVTLGPRHSETLWSFASLANWLESTATPQSAIRDPQSAIVGLLWVARAGQLEFTCVDAAAGIGATLRQFGGAILMSATLQPFAEFAESCGLSAYGYSTLVAPAPWRTGAYDVAVDLRVDTSFRHRANHYATTAATIAALHEAASHLPTPDSEPRASRAVAVFFPSYAYAESILRTLENYNSPLRVVLQPKLPDLAAQAAWVEENLALSDVLFLVLGSSFAEGIDLLGGRVSHAMVVGPALPEVNAIQKARTDALSGLGRDAAFRRVYQIPGLQKVNQALGRLVRAPGQRAKVLLHCGRFADPSYAKLLASEYQLYSEIGSDGELQEWLRR